MSFSITTEKMHFSYHSPEDLLTDYKRIIRSILDSPVLEFNVSDSRDCLDYLKENVINLPIVKNSRRQVYFGEFAHYLVYNLALSGEFPKL